MFTLALSFVGTKSRLAYASDHGHFWIASESSFKASTLLSHCAAVFTGGCATNCAGDCVTEHVLSFTEFSLLPIAPLTCVSLCASNTLRFLLGFTGVPPNAGFFTSTASGGTCLQSSTCPGVNTMIRF